MVRINVAKGRCKVSEKTLVELIWDLMEQLYGAPGYYSRVVMLDACLAKADAAERVAEAWLAWCDSGNVDGTWDAFWSAMAEYKAAREAVRKLEGQT